MTGFALFVTLDEPVATDRIQATRGIEGATGPAGQRAAYEAQPDAILAAKIATLALLTGINIAIAADGGRTAAIDLAQPRASSVVRAVAVFAGIVDSIAAGLTAIGT